MASKESAGAPDRTSGMKRFLVVALVLGLVLGGCGLLPGTGQPTTKLKPAAGQTYPTSFGDRNTIVATMGSTEEPMYKDASGRQFTISVRESPNIVKDWAAQEPPGTTRQFGDVYCFKVETTPKLCRMQLAGGLLSFSSSETWDGERIAGILHDFYAQMHD